SLPPLYPTRASRQRGTCVTRVCCRRSDFDFARRARRRTRKENRRGNGSSPRGLRVTPPEGQPLLASSTGRANRTVRRGRSSYVRAGSVTRMQRRQSLSGDYFHVKPPSSFRCVHCRLDVPTDAPGTAHRNHCPNCLWSRHLDVDPRDREYDCLASTEPHATS